MHEEDTDINCGKLINGTASIDEKGERTFQRMLRAAAGEKTRRKIHGYGKNDFVPCALGAVM